VREPAELLGIAAFIVVAAAVIVALMLALRRHAARIIALESANRALAGQVDRLALLDRREAACAPFDALWLCWSRCTPPDEEVLRAAALAAEGAKRLFPAELAPDLDEVSRLLSGLVRHRSRQRDAVLAGRHRERVELIEEEAEMEHKLRPKLAGLRTLLADAARPATASGSDSL
jgi:hypothetical protein